MCAIVSWSGKLPKGLVSRLMTRMEVRGRDSVGLAFRLDSMSTSFKQAVSASEFVDNKENSDILGDARRSLRGIIHTRRASLGMPIDDRNAHPFSYWRYFFAHNGKIQNWKEIRSLLQDYYRGEVTRLTELGDKSKAEAEIAKYCVKYCDQITTDSMVLGPYIELRDFSNIVGCMGLVWMRGPDVYVFRYAKEAVAATVIWRYTKEQKGEKVEDQVVTLVASTPQIIESALDKVPDIEYDLSDFNVFPEGRIFRIEPMGLKDEGEVPTNQPVEDSFSSEPVEAAATPTGPVIVEGQ